MNVELLFVTTLLHAEVDCRVINANMISLLLKKLKILNFRYKMNIDLPVTFMFWYSENYILHNSIN